MRSDKVWLPDSVSETVGLQPVPNYEEKLHVAYVDFVTMKRYNEGVKLTPCLTPVNYRDTIVCYKDSTRKRFKSQTHYEPKVKPRNFSDTLIVFPKRAQKSFVTCVDYHIDECRRWFKTTMEFKAKTYTTSKIIGPDVDTESESGEIDAIDTDTRVNGVVGISNGPGASQVYLPRWNHEDHQRGKHQYPDLVNGDHLFNGYCDVVR